MPNRSTVVIRCVFPNLKNLVKNEVSRWTCNPTNLIMGSRTSTRSSKSEQIGTHVVQSGKKNTNSVVAVLGGVGAQRVKWNFLGRGSDVRLAPYLALG